MIFSFVIHRELEVASVRPINNVFVIYELHSIINAYIFLLKGAAVFNGVSEVRISTPAATGRQK